MFNKNDYLSFFPAVICVVALFLIDRIKEALGGRI